MKNSYSLKEINPLKILGDIFFPNYYYIRENDNGKSYLFSFPKSLEELRGFQNVQTDNSLEELV